MLFKITIEEIKDTEYEETENVYIDAEGNETENYNQRQKTISRPTGEKRLRRDTKTIYSQEVKDIFLNDVIKAINAIK